MKCPKCQFENANEVKYCQQCGAPILLNSRPEQISVSTIFTLPSKMAWYKRWWVWLIFCLGLLFVLLGVTCASCTRFLFSQPKATQSTISEKSFFTDAKQYFYDISYEYNSEWYVRTPIVGEGYEYTKSNPTIKLSVYALSYSDEEEIDTILDAYRKPKPDIRLIDEKEYSINNVDTIVHRFMRSDKTEDELQYVDISAFGYSGIYYTFIIKSDYENRQECEEIMDKTINSIMIYEHEEKSEEPQKETDIPTEKQTEKPTEKETEPPTEAVSREYKNALDSAYKYLKYTAFSKDGLYAQLLYEKFSEDAAQYAVDNVAADWNENALKSAEKYMKITAFSKEGLFEQLVYEKYTDDQAQYAVDNVNADWDEAAVKAAEKYLQFSSMSKDELYDQLIYEKYTPEQAQYAVDKVY